MCIKNYITLTYITLIINFSIHNSINCQDWKIVNLSFPEGDSLLTFATVNFINENLGWLLTSGNNTKLFETNNGGETWTLKLVLPGSFSNTKTISLGQNNIWFFGSLGKIVFSNDKGITWDSSKVVDGYLQYHGGEFASFNFFNSEYGIASNNYRWFTEDGGFSWQQVDTIMLPQFEAIEIVNDSIVWAVSMFNPNITHLGSIYYSNNGGNKWQHIDEYFGLMFDIDIIDSLTIFAVGTSSNWASGNIEKTLDGGKTWSNKNYMTGGPFYSIKFLNDKKGWVVGRGKILNTTDTGTTWNIQVDTLQTDLTQLIILKEEKKAYAFGKDWNEKTFTLLKADLSNLTNIKDKTTEYNNITGYQLLGNYPNPFNPSTTIKYNLPKESAVDLRIYDIMGREIKTFIISSQPTGVSEIEWDGTNNNGIKVSSGVYLYKFEALSISNNEHFSKSNKLVFIK